MQTNFFPNREADIVTWTNNFKEKLLAGGAAYGISIDQANAYALKSDLFVAAYRTCQDNTTRTPSAIASKNDLKASLESEARMLARIVRANPAVTMQQRYELGLCVSDGQGPKIDAPTLGPRVSIVSVRGNIVRVRLMDAESPTSRGKARAAIGVSIFTHIGDEAPKELPEWTFVRNTTRTSVDVAFASDITPGAKVWLTARWYTRTAKNSPLSSPIATNIQGGGVSVATGLAIAA